MADLQINPLNVSGLAAAAGEHVGFLNLPVADLGKYPAMYSEMVNRLQLQKLQNQGEIQRQQVANQGVLGAAGLQADKAMSLQQNSQQFQAQQNAAQRVLESQHYNQQNQYQQAVLGNEILKTKADLAYKSGQLQNEQDKNYIEAQNVSGLQDYRNSLMDYHKQDAQTRAAQIDLLAKTKLNQSELNQRGSAGSLLLTYFETHDPSQWEGVRPLMDMYHKNGIIGDQEYDQYKQMPIEALHGRVIQDIMASDAAEKIKSNPQLMNSLNLSVKGQTSAAQAKAEQSAQDQISQSGQIKSLSDLIKNNPNAFTTMGNLAAEGGTVAGRAPILSSIVNAGFKLLGQDPEQAENVKTTIDSQATSLWGDIGKNLSARLLASAKTDFKDKLIPNTDKDSPQQALVKAQILDQIHSAKLQLDRAFIKNGVVTNQDAYDTAMQNLFTKGLTASAPTFNGKPVDMDKMRAMNPGMSDKDIIQNIKQHEGNQ